MKKWRVNFIFILIILFGAAIIGRLFYSQVTKHDYYKALAWGQQTDLFLLKGERGEIFLKDSKIAATNIKEDYVFISPYKIEDKENTAKALSEILGLEEEVLLEKINKDSLFEEIKRDLTEQEINSLKEKELSGVHIDQSTDRKYPQNSLASQVIGFLGGEEKGQYGVEGYYDDILQGKEYYKRGEDVVLVSEKSLKGADLYLTIDYNIQFFAEKLLKNAERELNIEGGLIIVLDPNNGKVLALANYPSFDPNFYSEIKDFDVFQNGAVQKIFEPGSVFKAITMASALDQEKITPQTTYVDDGVLKIGGYKIYNYDNRVWGERTMTEVLERSINTGAVFAERQLGHNLFLEYIDKFGFFKSTNIDIQGEIFSENKEFKKGYEINFATAAFGQGIEITPIQLVKAFAAIANGGKLVRPYVVEKIAKDGEVIKTEPQISEERIISQKTASQLTAMLVSVVENGYAKKATVPRYYIAGKTGTSQVPFSAIGISQKGYSDKTWQSFLGFAPAYNARFVVLIKLDNPQTNTAEYSAVPIFSELAKYIIDYMQIPPDYEE